MTPKLRIHLLGDFRLTYGDAPITTINTARLQALLAYLVLHRDAQQLRQHLAFLFWPDSPEDQARTNLRKLYYLLRNALPAADRFLSADAKSLGWRADAPFTLDAADFENAAAQAESADALQAALEHYQGDLLSSCYDDWIVPVRGRLRQTCIAALERLTQLLERRRDCRTAIRCAQLLLQHDPLNEATYRCLIRLHVMNGDRAEAMRVYRTCVEVLRRELNAEPSPATREVYERALHTSTFDARLPAQSTPFIGRERELAEIARRLTDPACRLLTLVGLGGIGKSRLALQAALEHADTFADGVYFVPLAPISSANLIVPAIAEALRFSFFGQTEPRLQLLNYLREKQALLVIDNFEHVIDGAGLLSEILSNAPRIKIMLTSRERLNVRKEQLLEVSGLDYPRAPGALARQVEGFSAVQLFEQTAHRVNWAFALTPDQEPAVARVCQLVEGMPLAVELAAAWTRVLTCAEIAHEIERGLDILATALRGLPDRHRSLRVLFDYSWQLLTAEERRVFSDLAVFRGGFERAAGEQVAGTSFRTLAALVDASCLRRTPAGRYEIHELLRQYGEEKLSAAAAISIGDRHCAYYADFVQQCETQLKGSDQRRALDEIAAEIDNVRAGWRWAVQHDRAAEIDRFMPGLTMFYEIRSFFQEGVQVFEQAVQASASVNDTAPSVSRKRIGQLRARQAKFLALLGEFKSARQLLELSTTALRDYGTPRDLAFALRELAEAMYRLGEYDRAMQLAQESLSLQPSDAADERYDIALALNLLGSVERDTGNYVQARQHLELSCALREAIGDRQGLAKALNNLGILCTIQGDYAEAKRLLEESLTIRRELGDDYGAALALNNLGNIATALEDFVEARRLYQESLAIRRAIGDRFAIALVINNLGNIAHLQGDYAEAQQLCRESLATRRAIGDRRGVAGSLNSLGGIASAQGDYQAAREYFREALQIALEINARQRLSEILTEVAELLANEGQLEGSIELLTTILNDQVAESEVRQKAQRQMDKLLPRLSPHAVQTAQTRMAAASLDDVATGAFQFRGR